VTFFYKYRLPSEKLLRFVSEGAPVMFRKKNNVAAKLKKQSHIIRRIYLFIYLFIYLASIAHFIKKHCARSSVMGHLLDTVVKTVNIIHATGLNIGSLKDYRNRK
jgi:hypothetical protein